jgi:hypothetical protein
MMNRIYNETNQRIYERNIPSNHLAPSFGIRSEETRQTHFKILNEKQSFLGKLEQIPHSVKNTFYPGDSTGPWSGYVANVDVESVLKNQVMALQHNDNAVYVPSSKSELYNNHYSVAAPPPANTGLLFDPFTPHNRVPPRPIPNMAHNPFNEHTRQSLKNAPLR